MKKIKFTYRREFFYLSLIFLLTIFAWIMVEIYHIEKNSKLTVEYETSLKVDIKPLPDVDFLETLEQKK
jgi:hypothetical protein